MSCPIVGPHDCGGANHAQPAEEVRLVGAMHLVDTADAMFWEIRSALAGHEWFDCWASINEAAALATRTILREGPRVLDAHEQLFEERNFDGGDAHG